MPLATPPVALWVSARCRRAYGRHTNHIESFAGNSAYTHFLMKCFDASDINTKQMKRAPIAERNAIDWLLSSFLLFFFFVSLSLAPANHFERGSLWENLIIKHTSDFRWESCVFSFLCFVALRPSPSQSHIYIQFSLLLSRFCSQFFFFGPHFIDLTCRLSVTRRKLCEIHRKLTFQLHRLNCA